MLDDQDGLYQITLLKREPKDFSLTQIKQEIERGKQLLPLYQVAKRLLPMLEISNESITYYASLVHYYSVYRLNRFDRWQTYLYLLCFIYHRHQKVQDHLIEGLCFKVREYHEDAKEASKTAILELRMQTNQYVEKAGQVLSLFTDETIEEDLPFAAIQQRAFSILKPEQINYVAEHLSTHIRFDARQFEWAHIDQLARQFKLNLRLQALSLATSSKRDVLACVEWFVAAFAKGRPLRAPLPDAHVPDAQRRYLVKGPAKEPVPDRYEFLLYRHLRQGLESGDIFCHDSVRYRSFEDDLIDDQRWQHQQHLIRQTGLEILEQPIKTHLEDLKDQLEYRLAEVNDRIAAGENKYFKVKPNGKWTLRYPPGDEAINHSFFSALEQVQIADVLHFTHQRCRFMDSFDHILGRFTKTTFDPRVLVAALVGWGTNMGLGKMAQNSDMRFMDLSQVSDKFIRLETLAMANDRVANATASLPLFDFYDMPLDTDQASTERSPIGPVSAHVGNRHSSSDGQKYETRFHTFRARHSPKYFGLKKGVVSYTMIANHAPVNAELIGAHDHESHYAPPWIGGLICSLTTPPTLIQTSIRPILMGQMRLILRCFICLATNLHPATGISTIKSRRASMDSIIEDTTMTACS